MHFDETEICICEEREYNVKHHMKIFKVVVENIGHSVEKKSEYVREGIVLCQRVGEKVAIVLCYKVEAFHRSEIVWGFFPFTFSMHARECL